MRVLPGAAVAEARRCLGRGERLAGPHLRVYRRGLRLDALSLILGALIGATYARFMLPRAEWPAYAVCTIGGACACFLLIAIPVLTWVALRRLWARLALRLSDQQLGDLLSVAQDVLGEAATGQRPAEDAESDLAVVRCLQAHHDAAVGALQRLHERERSSVAANNLLAALTETRRWRDVGRLLEGELGRPDGPADANLALVAALAPHDHVLEDLWIHVREASCPQTLNNLGVRFLQAGDLALADEALSLATKQRPFYALAHANLGVLAYRRQDYALAVTQMASAATLGPGDAAAYGNLGAALCEAGDPRLGRRWLGRAQAISPANSDVLVNLGNAYALEGRCEEAVEAYTQATQLRPSAAAHHNAALVLLASDREEAALHEQLSAHELAPTDPDVINNLGCLLWLRRRYADAREHLERAARQPYNLTAKANLVRAELAAGHPARALDLLLKYFHAEKEMEFDRGLVALVAAAQTQPEDGAGVGSARERDLAEAIAGFRGAIARGREAMAEAYVDLGIAQYLSEDYQEAAEAFTAAAELTPTRDELSYPIAVCYLMSAGEIQHPEADGYEPPPPAVQELLQKARPHLAKAVGVRAIADAARLNLGILHYLLGDYEEAITVLRPIARPDSPWEVLNVLAIGQARQARELQRSTQTAPLLGAIRKGQMLAEVGKLLSAAIHSFTHVLRQQPSNAIAHANIGLAHYLRNRGDDVEQALHHWQRMRQTGGEWGERIYEIFTVAMSSEGAHRLRFQDIEVAFRPLLVDEWIACPPPRMVGLKYAIAELLDLPPPHLEAHHPLVKRALACRDRAERLRLTLRRLTS